MNEEMVVQRLADLVGEMASVASQVGEDADRVDVITMLEKLKGAAAAAQLSVVADFAASQEAGNRALGVEARAARRGVPEQVGMARKVAPATAARQVSQAEALRDDLPETFALLAAGQISEWVSTIIVTETSHLAAEDRRVVDKHLAIELPELSPRRAQARAKALAYEVDPEGTVRRAGNARRDRRVSMRPAPDTMAMLSALLPCEQGVAAWAALRRHADRLLGTGDERSRDQIMADTLVERLTGQATADSVDAEIGLVMTGSALFGGDDEAAELGGYGPIPAETARDIARRAVTDEKAAADTAGVAEPSMAEPSAAGAGAAVARADTHEAGTARVWLRRLVTDPVTGIVTDCDPRRRRFTGVLAQMLIYRDQYCRTRTATPPSGISTTSNPMLRADPQVRATGRACANAATTCVRCPAGPVPSPTRTATSSRPRHPPDTGTDHAHQRYREPADDDNPRRHGRKP